MKAIKKFTDEKDFTINAVIPWLKTRKEYGDIEYTGGNDEYGRDVVFSKLELGNRKIWWAIQVKDGDIKGTHKGNSSIQEIVNQLKSAMSIPYTYRGDTTKITIQGLMIVTLGKITKNASEIIKNSEDLKGRSIIFYEYSDILQDLKESPMNVSTVRFLVRLKADNKEASFKKLEQEFNKAKFKFQWNFYNHEPIDDMFDLEDDNYVDLTFSLFFEDIYIDSIWKKIIKLIKKSCFNVGSINLRIYYPKVFSTKELEKAKMRFLKDTTLKIYEDQSGPCFIYNCNNINFNKEEWLKNVNNMQILQKN